MQSVYPSYSNADSFQTYFCYFAVSPSSSTSFFCTGLAEDLDLPSVDEMGRAIAEVIPFVLSKTLNPFGPEKVMDAEMEVIVGAISAGIGR